MLQIEPHQVSSGLYKATVTVLKLLSGKIIIKYKNKKLAFKVFRYQRANGQIVSAKELNFLDDQIANLEKLEKEKMFQTEHFLAVSHAVA